MQYAWRQFVHDIISAGEVPRSQTQFVVNRRSTFASFESYFLRPRAWLARSVARVISTSDKFPDEFEPTEENLPHDEPTWKQNGPASARGTQRLRSVTVLCSKGSMFRRFYVPKVLRSEGSTFRRFYVPKVLYSKGFIFRRFYVPKVPVCLWLCPSTMWVFVLTPHSQRDAQSEILEHRTLGIENLKFVWNIEPLEHRTFGIL